MFTTTKSLFCFSLARHTYNYLTIINPSLPIFEEARVQNLFYHDKNLLTQVEGEVFTLL